MLGKAVNIWYEKRQKEEEYKVNKEQKEGPRNERERSGLRRPMNSPGMVRAKPDSKRQRVSDADFKRQV